MARTNYNSRERISIRELRNADSNLYAKLCETDGYVWNVENHTF